MNRRANESDSSFASLRRPLRFVDYGRGVFPEPLATRPLPAGVLPALIDGGERLLAIFGVFHAAGGIGSGFDLTGFGLRDGDIAVRPGAVERLADAACGIESGGEISRLGRSDFLQGPGAPSRVADLARRLNGGREIPPLQPGP